MKTWKSLKITLFFLLLATVVRLDAKIVETPNFSAILDYIDKNTLVILDIDDTLLIPKQTLGNDAWFHYKFDKYKKEGIPADIALERTLAEWEAVRHLTQVEIVESNTADVVATMQKNGIPVIGLTTQGLALATRTIHHLQSLHIDLSTTAPDTNDFYFVNVTPHNQHGTVLHKGVLINDSAHQGVLYRKGILFTAGTNKSTALIELVKHFGIKPNQIVFINDKEAHLKDAEEGAVALGIPFVGLRYSYSDERINKFRADIAEVQFTQSSFARILSDEEALAIIRSNICTKPRSDL